MRNVLGEVDDGVDGPALFVQESEFQDGVVVLSASLDGDSVSGLHVGSAGGEGLFGVGARRGDEAETVSLPASHAAENLPVVRAVDAGEGPLDASAGGCVAWEELPGGTAPLFGDAEDHVGFVVGGDHQAASASVLVETISVRKE